jgi:hypothetical protein
VTHHVRLAAAATAELSSEAIQLAELSSEAVQLAERSSVRARLIQLAELSGEAGSAGRAFERCRCRLWPPVVRHRPMGGWHT